jgi:hypothetical protein
MASPGPGLRISTYVAQSDRESPSLSTNFDNKKAREVAMNVVPTPRLMPITAILYFRGGSTLHISSCVCLSALGFFSKNRHISIPASFPAVHVHENLTIYFAR